MSHPKTDKWEDRKKFEPIRKMLPRHFMILDMVVAGHSHKTIAGALGMNPTSIGLITRSPVFQKELARRRSEVEGAQSDIMNEEIQAKLGKARSILEQNAVAAAQKHVELMEAEDQSLQFRAAGAILDRVFGDSKSAPSQPTVMLSAEQANLLVVALQETNNGSQVPTANGTTAQGPSDEHGDVQEGSEAGQENVRRRQIQSEQSSEQVDSH